MLTIQWWQRTMNNDVHIKMLLKCVQCNRWHEVVMLSKHLRTHDSDINHILMVHFHFAGWVNGKTAPFSSQWYGCSASQPNIELCFVFQLSDDFISAEMKCVFGHSWMNRLNEMCICLKCVIHRFNEIREK